MTAWTTLAAAATSPRCILRQTKCNLHKRRRLTMMVTTASACKSSSTTSADDRESFSSSTSSSTATSETTVVRFVSINDVYDIDKNLPRLQTFLKQLQPKADAVLLCGDFLSPSTLSSIDCGRGMVATLRTVGITHVSLGNHEQDLQLASLQQRLIDLSAPLSHHANNPNPLIQIVNSNLQQNLPNDAQWMATVTQPYSIVSSRCGKIKIALLGLLSDEPGIFPNDTFKSVPIQNVLECYERWHQTLLPSSTPTSTTSAKNEVVHAIVPMTHQTMPRDKELAQHILQIDSGGSSAPGPAVILGGHEHEPLHEIVIKAHEDDDVGANTTASSTSAAAVHIFKSGMNADAARVVDLVFDTSVEGTGRQPQLVGIQHELVEIQDYEPSPIVQQVVNQHMSVIQALDNEVIVNADEMIPMLPIDFELSSKRTRYQQTTVGMLLCEMIKQQYEGYCDVAMINGATIKGDASYTNHTISYADLKNELPFPTKIVLVPMSSQELYDAILYSRTNIEEGTSIGDDGQQPPRRGYLQLDYDLAEQWEDLALQDKELKVALPRNLMNGFCKIQPLMKVGKQLKEQGLFPGPDDFVPAIDVIVRHSCKNRWYQLVGDKPFAYFDLNDDGVLDRDEVQTMLTKMLGYTPMDFVVDDMIASIDRDGNGVIDQGEFSFMLAQIERDHGKFLGGG